MSGKSFMTKLFSLLLVVIFAASFITGCIQTDSTTTEKDDSEEVGTENDEDQTIDTSEYYEVTIGLVDDLDPNEEKLKDKCYFRQQLKEKFNFGYKLIGYAGDTKEKLGLMLAAGDYTDILMVWDNKYLRKYVEADALYSLEPLIDKYAPNFKEEQKERIPYWKAKTGLQDNKLWSWHWLEPSMHYGLSSALNEWKIRSDILEEQGYPEVVSEDDVYQVIKQGVKDHPTTDGKKTLGYTQPFSAWGNNGLWCLTFAHDFGRLSHMTRKYGSIWDPDKDEYIDVFDDYSFYESMKFFNKLWREGLFDKDSVSDKFDDYTRKCATEGRALSTFFYNWSYRDWNKKLAQAGKEFRWIPFPGMLEKQLDNNEPKIYPITTGGFKSQCSITKNCEHPERIMQVLDWVATEDGMEAAGWGEEGVQYEWKDGLRVPTEWHLNKLQNDPTYVWWDGSAHFGSYGGVFENGQNYRMTNDFEYAKSMIDPKILDVYSNYGWEGYEDSFEKNCFDYDLRWPIGLTDLNPNYDDDQIRDWDKIENIQFEYTLKMVTAETNEDFDRYYNEMQEKRDELGLKELIRIRTEQHKEACEENNLDY